MYDTTIKIMAISGSLRSCSSNSALLEAAARLAPASMSFTLYNGLSGLPYFNPDIDSDGAFAPVEELRKQLKEADAVIICTPEYANGVPGALNALDWIVSSGEFMHKPTAVISASPSPAGGEKAA